MSPILIPSVVICAVALVWVSMVLRERRVWRLAALAVVIALLLIHQVVMLILGGGPSPDLRLVDHLVHLPNLALSIIALVAVIFVHRYTSHVRRTASELPLNEPHWRALIENALDRDLIAILDEDAVIQYASPSAKHILGYDRNDLIGQPVFDLVHPREKSQVQKAFAEGLRTPGPAATIELRLAHKDGSWRWLEAVGNNLLGDPELHCVVVTCRDVTDRKEREGEVKLRWDQTQQFLDVAEVMFVSLDKEGRITLVNRKGLSLLGYDNEGELLGQDWFDTCVPSELATEVRQVFRDCMARTTEGASYYENLVRTKDGRKRLIAWHNVVLHDAAGRPVGTLSAGEDISDRKETEQDLLKFRLGIEKSSEVVFLTDVDGKIVYANPSFQRVYGYSPEEVLGQTPRLLKSGRMSAKTYEEFWKALLSKQVVTGELLNQTKHGLLLTVESSVSPVLGEDGSIIGFLAIQRDITKRKDTEKALRRSETNYRELIQHAVYGIYRSTPDGKFVSVNPALVQMLGYDSEAELLDVDLTTDVYASPEQRDRMIDRYGEKPRIAGLDVEWKRKDGTVITVRLSGRSVPDETGKIQFYEMLVEDVTERRALEHQLRHAQKLEAIGQLTAGIAHDFNNILTTIIANADLALDAVPSDDTELRSDISEIGGAGRRAAEMIKKLMAFGRREHLDLEPLELSDVVGETVSMLRRVLPENIRIDFSAEEGSHLIQGNRGAIEQVLLNLAGNARDAMQSGGELRLAIGRFTIDAEYRRTHGWGKPGPYVLLAVSDTGVGMDARTCSRIFEPFFTTKAIGQGTGLGLAMVYGLVKQHGGFIDVYSEPGLGTTFNLYLQLSEAEDAAVPEVAPSELPHGTETILVVEDEDAIRRSAQRILERHGYRVLAAPDGQEAAEFLRQHGDQIDIVISDVVMPKLGGLQLYEEARDSGSPPPFLFTSGYAPGEILERTSGTGHAVFLRKPWTVSDLVLCVREALDNAS
jgi:PAS domain S-box-containing protein